jgi:hypothetical protein
MCKAFPTQPATEQGRQLDASGRQRILEGQRVRNRPPSAISETCDYRTEQAFQKKRVK